MSLHAPSRPRSRGIRSAIILPLFVLATTGCDVITADLKHSETAEWRKTYQLAPGGRVEIENVNGRIQVQPSEGDAVEVVVQKTAKGATPEAAKEALGRIEIREDASPASIKIATKIQRTSHWLEMGGAQVKYSVRVPASADVRFSTVNGGVEVVGLSGRVVAETTNGGVIVRDVSGTIDASTTNGGVDVELSRLGEGGAKLECTNGGIKLRLPRDSKASISAAITNGGIETSGLALETIESSRRKLEARLNGGGAPIRLEGTNGGITIASR
jgi:hypothetical protein